MIYRPYQDQDCKIQKVLVFVMCKEKIEKKNEKKSSLPFTNCNIL